MLETRDAILLLRTERLQRTFIASIVLNGYVQFTGRAGNDQLLAWNILVADLALFRHDGKAKKGFVSFPWLSFSAFDRVHLVFHEGSVYP
jgi:hypothetical protein